MKKKGKSKTCPKKNKEKGEFECLRESQNVLEGVPQLCFDPMVKSNG